jgi:hypothetical protein
LTVVPTFSWKRAAHSWYTGCGNVAPAPLRVPPSCADLVPEPVVLGVLLLVSSLPHAATPMASAAAAAASAGVNLLFIEPFLFHDMTRRPSQAVDLSLLPTCARPVKRM